MAGKPRKGLQDAEAQILNPVLKRAEDATAMLACAALAPVRCPGDWRGCCGRSMLWLKRACFLPELRQISYRSGANQLISSCLSSLPVKQKCFLSILPWLLTCRFFGAGTISHCTWVSNSSRRWSCKYKSQLSYKYSQAFWYCSGSPLGMGCHTSSATQTELCPCEFV